jgi:hypothetical protein
MQIIIAFNKRFWPERLYDVICTHSFVPEFWMTQHAVIDEANKHLHAVVGECTSSSNPGSPLTMQLVDVEAQCVRCSAFVRGLQSTSVSCLICQQEDKHLVNAFVHCAAATAAADTGFIAGPRADALAAMGAQAAVQKFLAQLDEIFGSTEEPKPATAAYAKAHVFDWSQEQWVGGAYSFPSFGAEEGDREALAAPVAGTIFFAGEAVGQQLRL